MEQWYTLHTKPKGEYQVATALRRRGLEMYLPQIAAPRSRRPQKRKPFFPGYLFIKADLELVGLSQVRWTPGLRRIVAFDDRPVAVPQEAIDLIRHKLGEIEAAGGRPEHGFEPGDTVRITDGPFRDMLAIFDGPTTPAERVRVLLDILGHANRVQVAVTDLEKTTARAEAPTPRRPRRSRGRGRRVN